MRESSAVRCPGAPLAAFDFAACERFAGSARSLENAGAVGGNRELLPLEFAANPPVRIVRLVEDGRRLAEARQMIKLAGFDRRADFVFGNDLNRTIGEKLMTRHADILPQRTRSARSD